MDMDVELENLLPGEDKWSERHPVCELRLIYISPRRRFADYDRTKEVLASYLFWAEEARFGRWL